MKNLLKLSCALCAFANVAYCATETSIDTIATSLEGISLNSTGYTFANSTIQVSQNLTGDFGARIQDVINNATSTMAPQEIMALCDVDGFFTTFPNRENFIESLMPEIDKGYITTTEQIDSFIAKITSEHFNLEIVNYLKEAITKGLTVVFASAFETRLNQEGQETRLGIYFKERLLKKMGELFDIEGLSSEVTSIGEYTTYENDAVLTYKKQFGQHNIYMAGARYTTVELTQAHPNKPENVARFSRYFDKKGAVLSMFEGIRLVVLGDDSARQRTNFATEMKNHSNVSYAVFDEQGIVVDPTSK